MCIIYTECLIRKTRYLFHVIFSSAGMRKPFSFNFLIFLLFRLSSVFIISTSYVPDEYWQSLEIAHYMVFNYGYLTWEWKEGLRSYLYPSFFAIFYKLLEAFHLDFPFLLITVPKLLQAILTAVSDLYFLELTKKFNFADYWTKLVVFTNWFWYYCGFRTITNSFETSVTIIALYFYPWNLLLNKKELSNEIASKIKSQTRKYVFLAGINCVVRPTAATIWGPLMLCQLLFTPLKHLKSLFFTCALPVFIVILLLSVIIDFFWYGKFIIPAYNFFFFNVIYKISSFYGTHSFHWYVTQGLPTVLGLHYVMFLIGFVSIFVKPKEQSNEPYKKVYQVWLSIVVLNLIILSNIPHKEFRFVLPITPLMMLIVIQVCSDFFTPKRKKYKSLWTVISVIGFVIPCILFGILHQRGTLKVMELLRNSVDNCYSNCSFLFLMPCHSTPLYSHLHVNVSTRFLTCEPSISPDHYDESENFFSNPLKWLNSNWDDLKNSSHIIFFDSEETLINPFLIQNGFKEKHKILHSVFEKVKSRRYILVYES